MADESGARSRARTDTRIGTRTWPVERARQAWGAAWPQAEFAVPARIREWAVIEVGAGRLLPWFAVAFGTGIVLYFTAEREPIWWAAAALAAVAAIAAVLLRRRPVGFVLALGFFAICAGFAVATSKTALIEHPVLRYPAFSVQVAGFVELREESQKTDRFVLRLTRIEGSRIVGKPERVRLSVRRGATPPAGAYIEAKAQLNPPLEPLRPGSYDFARDLYFQRIGASGFVHGAIKIVTPPAAEGWRLRVNAFIQGLRDAIDLRIRSVLSGDVGSIASALITGKRDAISPHVYDAMFVSGIGHVLSISGYHMAVVAGVVFFIVRALLALIPGLADRAPIKKWAAFAALLVTAFYLVLSGAEVATQRSFIMIAIVLIGVMLDRPILTLRTVTIAALVVLLFAPEAVVHPSFQMSFAATLALIAGYERGMPWARAGADTSLGARAALWGVREIVESHSRLAARRARDHALRGLSFPPARALRRARQSPGDAGRVRLGDADGHSRRRRHAVRLRRRVLAADGVRHRMDGRGRALGGEPARRVRPRHVFRHRAAFARDRGPAGDLSSEDAAALERRRVRRCSRSFAPRARRVPDILVAADGRTFAVRGADGRLAFHRTGGDTFAMREWLAADADGRDVHDPRLGDGIACDPSGCIGKLADGRLVSYALAPDASRGGLPARQPSSWRRAMRRPIVPRLVIGRRLWRERGALTLRRDGTGFVIEFGPAAEFRPALGAATGAQQRGANSETPAASRAPPRDATPQR